MKKILALLTLTTIAACPWAVFGQASLENDPAYLPIDKVLDLKANPPQVNVNLPQFLLKDTLSGLNNTNWGTEGMDLADLAKDVKLIRVVVFEGNATNRAAIKTAMKTLRKELEAKWTSIVSVSDENDKVGIYAMGNKSGNGAAGIAVLVYDGDGGDAVIANVVGNVSIGKLLKLASTSPMVPKDIIKKLQGGAGDQPGASTAPKEQAAIHSPATNTPAEAPGGEAHAPVEK